MLSALHGIFTNWSKMTNKTIIPRSTILHHLFYACRYHIGSFAFMSVPLVPTIQIIRTICDNHMLEMKFKENPYNIYCFLVIILNLPTNTLIVCTSRGNCYYPSMKGAFKVLVQNSMKFTAIRLVITEMLFFGLILMPGITTGLAVLLYYEFWSTIYFRTYLAATYSITIIITSGILFVFSAAVDSVLFCHLEELLKNRKATDEGLENN